MSNSVQRHAAGLTAPALDTEIKIGEGARHYEQACTVCHGAPGVEPMEFTRGLNPQPPHFDSGGRGAYAGGWSPTELFWLIKHGLKMTGMPAWDDIFSDRQIWSLVAFLRALLEMKPDRYKQLSSTSPDQAG